MNKPLKIIPNYFIFLFFNKKRILPKNRNITGLFSNITKKWDLFANYGLYNLLRNCYTICV
jgi:hypothetical protein